MDQHADINLYKAKTVLSTEAVVLAWRLKAVSIVTLVVSLGLGVALTITYLLLRTEKTQLEAKKDQVTTRIISQVKKEALVLELKDRLAVISKIMQTQKSWITTINTVSSFVEPPLLLSFHGDDTKQLQVAIKASSIGDVIPIVQGATRETLASHMQKTILDSVRLGKDGSVQLSILFQRGE